MTDDPKDEFDAAASGATPLDDEPLDFEGEDNFHSREERKAARKRAQAFIDGTDVNANDEERGYTKSDQDKRGYTMAGDDDGQGMPLYDERWWGKFHRRVMLNIEDKGDYYRVSGVDKKNPMTGKREVTDAQLRVIITTAVMTKGWDTIYFYNGNRLDQQLTARANALLKTELGAPGHKLDGYNARVSANPLKPGEEPWAGRLRKSITAPLQEKTDAVKAAWANKKVELKEKATLAGHFKKRVDGAPDSTTKPPSTPPSSGGGSAAGGTKAGSGTGTPPPPSGPLD